jgi:hypothetical protein
MWKSWFIGHELVWMAVPAMFIFLGTFLIATVRALKKPQSEVSAVAALPLLDDVTSSSASPSH